MANRACAEIDRRAIRNNRARQVFPGTVVPWRLSLSPPYARFAMQAVLFASLTLRAARNYVRYSATLRSYSGFQDQRCGQGAIRLARPNPRCSL